MSRTAVVTGSASGIGAAIASALERDGWTVAGLDAKLAAPYGVDTSDPAAVSEALSRIADDIGPIDAVVSAAGHYDMTPVSQITPEQLRRMLRVHLGGLRNLARSVLPSMISRRQGAIVAITSELAIGGGDGDAHYAAAKGAIIGLVRSLAAEVAAQGVRVNGVAPGPTDTPLLAADSPWRAPDYLRTLPMRRLSPPDEVAAVRAVPDRRCAVLRRRGHLAQLRGGDLSGRQSHGRSLWSPAPLGDRCRHRRASGRATEPSSACQRPLPGIREIDPRRRATADSRRSADVSDPAAVRAWPAEVERTRRPIDVLVANAAYMTHGAVRRRTTTTTGGRSSTPTWGARSPDPGGAAGHAQRGRRQHRVHRLASGGSSAGRRPPPTRRRRPG